MNNSYSITKIYQKFSKLNAGIIFVNSVTQRIETALKLVEFEVKNIDYIIWIAPANFLNTLIYTNEIKKNSQTFRHKILYYTIETLSVSDEKYLELYNLVNNYKTFCIIDESLTIKNTESGRTQRLLMLSHFFTYKLILCCPPVTQGLIDLYSQLEFLDNKILKMNEQQFKNIFMPYKYKNYTIDKRWSRPENQAHLLKIMKPYILCHNINKIFNINHFDYFFELTSQEKSSYLEEKTSYLQKKNRLIFMEIVQAFQKMYTFSYNKLQGLKQLLSEIQKKKEKTLIYLKFCDEIDFIRETKILNDTPIIELSKRTNKKKAIKAFERNIDILFCTYGVEKFGLNMQICNNVIYYSQTFDYRCKLQSLNSFFFKGLTSELNVYDFWVQTKLEQLIKDNLEHKEFLLSDLYKKITISEVLKL